MNSYKMWVILITILALGQARIYQNSYQFTLLGNTRGWIFIDKMTFAPGTGRIIFQTTVTGTPKGRGSQIFMQAVPEERWEREQEDMCKSPVRMPLAVHNIAFDGSATISQFQLDISDYKTYYFVLKDCQSRLLNDYNNPNLFLAVKLHMLNNQREVGQEQDHWYIVPFILGASIILINYYYKQYKKQENHDWSKILLFAGIVTQVSSLFWKSCGFLLYSYTGSDHQFFHFIYLFLHSTSESTVISLVVLIGFGWTINYNYGSQLEVLLPMISSLGIINIVITVITKIGHSYDRHHIFDNVGGTILIVFRMVFILVFICGTIYTYIQTRQPLKAFIIKFAIVGLIYIGSMPTIVWLANYMIQPKSRHEFVFITVEAVKFVTNLILAYQFNAKNSSYNKAHVNNSSFIPQDHSGF